MFSHDSTMMNRPYFLSTLTPRGSQSSEAKTCPKILLKNQISSLPSILRHLPCPTRVQRRERHRARIYVTRRRVVPKRNGMLQKIATIQSRFFPRRTTAGLSILSPSALDGCRSLRSRFTEVRQRSWRRILQRRPRAASTSKHVATRIS